MSTAGYHQEVRRVRQIAVTVTKEVSFPQAAFADRGPCVSAVARQSHS